MIGIIIIGEDYAFHAGGNAIALHQCAGRRGQHDAGPVIVGEGDGTFNGPGGKDHLLGADHTPCRGAPSRSSAGSWSATRSNSIR